MQNCSHVYAEKYLHLSASRSEHFDIVIVASDDNKVVKHRDIMLIMDHNYYGLALS